MAVYNKFNQFVRDVLGAKHDFTAATYKVMLTNIAPTASNQIKSDLTEIAAGNGYTAGGPTTTITVSVSIGIAKVVGSNVAVTATGAVGPFQYAVLYNDSQTTPAKPLVGWWDYGTSITMSASEVFTVAFDATNGVFTVQ
jgi:hypothetical protein